MRPARATADFADAANSPIAYTEPLLKSDFNCASLSGRSVAADATVESAKLVSATTSTPAFCDARGVIAPSIKFDVALPVAWNERLYGFGNGGCGGVLSDYFPDRNLAVAKGFAVASTDTDLENPSGTCAWAANRPDLVVDFAYAGVHDTALVAKALVQLYYSRAPLASYYNDCSDGGHDGLEEAQRFPTDYDGIVAGAPFLGAGAVIAGAWAVGAFANLPAREPMTPAKMNYIASVVYAKCDGLDGLRDGIINDPQTCATVFKPSRDLAVCQGATNGSDCLTPAQLAAYEKALGPTMSRGVPFYPGQALGAEVEYKGNLIPATGAARTATMGYFLSNSYMQYLFPWPQTDPSAFSVFTFDFDQDPYKISSFRDMFDPTQLNMDAFFDRGGKLLAYHGWADPLISAYATVAYYEDLAKRYGSSLHSKFQFFAVPGMGHCGGGPGANQFDPVTKIVEWVEGHVEPKEMIASRLDSSGSVEFTRPLCAYPDVARYEGGSPNSAASFACIPGPTGVPDTGSNDGLQLP